MLKTAKSAAMADSTTYTRTRRAAGCTCRERRIPAASRYTTWTRWKRSARFPRPIARGAAVDPKTHHGFASSKPVVMLDTKTLATIKTIDVKGGPDGYLFDPFNERVWILSHSQPNATMIDAKDGSVAAHRRLGRRAGAGRYGRQGPHLRRSRRQGPDRRRGRQGTQGERALRSGRQGRRPRRAGIRREESHSLRRLPQSARTW